MDGRPLQGGSAPRGIGTYVAGLLDGLASLGMTSRLSLLLSRDALPSYLATSGAGVGPRLPCLNRRIQPLADSLLVAGALRRHRPRLYHATEYGQPAAASIPVVVTVHDLIPFVLPGYPWKSRERLRLAVHQLRRADRLIVPSRSTRDDCVRVAHCDLQRIRVVAHGVAPHFHPAGAAEIEATRLRLGLERPYLLAAGTFEPHKRPGLLSEVVARVRAEHDIDIVITGDQGIFQRRLEDALDRPELQGHVRILGHVSRSDLVALMSGAAAVVVTSAYEGFGLPVLEAMACGAPVAAFANSSIPEVGGEAALIAPDGDAAALASLLSALLADPHVCRDRAALGIERAAPFTWACAATETVAVYRELIGDLRP
ncbi:MAG: glycosyltransferase family 4 protein [Candidatus Dormibacteria bacterium]